MAHQKRRLSAGLSTDHTIGLSSVSNMFEKPVALSTTHPVYAHSLLVTSIITEEDLGTRGATYGADVWKPQKKELIVMISLSFISLMVALDATILVTVLPVSQELLPNVIKNF
jgi:hypothetical protein